MPLLPRRRDGEIDGDFARRRAFFVFLVFLTLLPASVWLFARIDPIWSFVVRFDGGAFIAAAALLGAVLAVLPVATVVALLMTVWYGVESVYLERSRSTVLLDRLIVAAGILVWFSPAIALLGSALRAVLSGSISFSRPPREYLLTTDPIAFWQSVGFLLIVAAAVAYPAWHYWRGKLMRRS